MGVTDVLELPAHLVEAQIHAVFSDIRPHSVKIGMVSSDKLIRVIAKALRENGAENVVVDPVMVATSGDSLFDDRAIKTLKTELFPLATIITPNLFEASKLIGMEITDKDQMMLAAKELHETTQAGILIKGGHLLESADDFFIHEKESKWLNGDRIATKNTHGTGCTLSSAIASYLAKGVEASTAVAEAKNYVRDAMSTSLDLGKGNGPLNHFARFYEE